MLIVLSMDRRWRRNYLLAAMGAVMAYGMTLTIAACSLMPVRSPQPGWVCDAEADAAVRSRQWQLALQLHHRFLESEPDNCLALYHLGYILGKLDQRRQEVETYERAVACGYSNDDRIFFNLGMAFVEISKPDKALAALERAIQLNPGNAENHFGLGYIAHLAGHGTRAVKALQKAIDLSEDHLDARNLLAGIYLDQGLLDEAKAQLQEIQRREPDNDEARRLWKIYEDRVMTAYDSFGSVPEPADGHGSPK
jgi:tetratricopeptide (TPR) repeat protein